jgi:hypothetical protein
MRKPDFLWKLSSVGQKSGLILATLILLAGTSFSQVLVDQQGQSCELRREGDKLIYSIGSPHVKEPITNFPNILFEEGDRVTVTAGGCVQTGGVGQTWKHYVNPKGPNSDRLYHGLISIPYITLNYRSDRIVQGFVRLKNIVGKEYVIPSLKDDGFEVNYLRLGYSDDDYRDNGYWGHDNGNEDQCRDVGNAYVRITIVRQRLPESNVGLSGVWQYTMTSKVSGNTYKGTLSLRMHGNQVSGTLNAPDGSRGEVTGFFNPRSEILTLSRDTGLETVQRYSLPFRENRFLGTFWNEGKYPDSGTFSITR